jgi:hypothetical protein
MDRTYNAEKAIVIEKLNTLGDEERMSLLNKYERLTESVFCKFNMDKNIDVITKIFLFKFDNVALIEAYVNGDPVVDYPGCRFNEFLDNEIAS